MAEQAASRRNVHVNGVDLRITEQGSGPAVILCHGFPELAYSWRHQLPALAAAGYRAVAPDQRGYGGSSRPERVTDYGIEALAGDLIALLDDLGEEQAVFVGHDWGALIVWDLALLHPERVRAVVGVSVPFIRWPMAPIQLLRMAAGDNFMYIVYFQDVGPAEKELEADPRRTMARTLWSVSGDFLASREGPEGPGGMVSPLPAEGTGFLTMMEDPPDPLPSWLTAADIHEFAAAFRTSGFFGPLSYYRNMDRNWEVTKDLAADRVAMPSMFIGGSLDPVITGNPAALDAMKELLPDLRDVVIIPGAGHWTQQERPDEVNQALLAFLGGL
ncbi:MAG: hypothetical protein QOG64_153 [Acidimicrobiaceae bacterium]|nr:hypothetical protein [Acidimicrobiaceae bacterium]